MKAIEFGEERLTDIEGLARELWQDERDPRQQRLCPRLRAAPGSLGKGLCLDSSALCFYSGPAGPGLTAGAF